MNFDTFDPVPLIFIMSIVVLMPLAIVMATSFLKISVVFLLLRNALGLQQVPPNIALNGLALILSAYVMAPVLTNVATEVRTAVTHQSAAATPEQRFDNFVTLVGKGAEPLRGFMMKMSTVQQRQFFVQTARSLWGEKAAAGLRDDNFVVLLPAFVMSQLKSAFQVGFLLYLPFIIIDLIVSNILLAMGMMMVSPITIAIPLKLFLFVMVDGWNKLVHGLVLSYL